MDQNQTIPCCRIYLKPALIHQGPDHETTPSTKCLLLAQQTRSTWTVLLCSEAGLKHSLSSMSSSTPLSAFPCWQLTVQCHLVSHCRSLRWAIYIKVTSVVCLDVGFLYLVSFSAVDPLFCPRRGEKGAVRPAIPELWRCVFTMFTQQPWTQGVKSISLAKM